jgi:hypothetical protein
MQAVRPRRWARRAALLFLTLSVAACGGSGLLLYRTYQAIDYPGATRVADQNLTLYTPNFVTRRTVVYRTDDPFPSVYNWYSNRFALGPESYAQGTCISMSKAASRTWLLEEQMSVMVCNTPTGRMMFVMRAFLVRYGS